jgi:adenylate cyclase
MKEGKIMKKKIGFSIGAKLILIISLIVVISLGSITALVSWLVRDDLRIAAEVNNFESNRQAAMTSESTFNNVRSNAGMLLRTITSAGIENSFLKDTADFYFQQNPQVAALFFSVGGQKDELFTSSRFYRSGEIDENLAASYRDASTLYLRRSAAGETLLLNAAPHFTIPMLAMFFPISNGGAAVLFSPSELSDSFGYGVNQSYLINGDGDVLLHPDNNLVRSGTNFSKWEFIRDICNSTQKNSQQLITIDSDFIQMDDNALSKSIYQEYREIIWKYTIYIVRETGNFIKKLFNKNIVISDTNKDNQIQLFVAYTRLNTGGVTLITSIEYNKVFEGIEATTRRNLYLTISVLSISIILIWFFSKTISIPLKSLASAAQSIEEGNFDLTLRKRGRDEIGILTNSFQSMCTALKIFGRFTNRGIAVKAMRGHIEPGGVPKHATIFFSDIREFTAKSENFTKAFRDDASNKIVFWLNEYFTRMIECIEKTGGVVDKFIGDAVMAHWGTAYTAGSPRKDAFNCVKAALMMRKALYDMNRKRMPGDPSDPPIRIGCGINTGIVTAGQIGSDLRMEYTVIGDPVNLASRTEALTKPLGTDILITEDTWSMINDSFITEEMPSVTVKGKAQPVRIFAVVNIRGLDAGPRTIADVRELLGIDTPDMAKVDVNADEKKYKIGGK